MADDGKIDHTDTIFIGGVNFTMTVSASLDHPDNKI